MIFPKSKFSPGPKHPDKNGMSHQHDSLTKPNRQPAHSVRRRGTDSNLEFSSVSVSPALSLPRRCPPALGPLGWRVSPGSNVSQHCKALFSAPPLAHLLARFPTRTYTLLSKDLPSLPLSNPFLQHFITSYPKHTHYLPLH